MDREKVKKGLECCSQMNGDSCRECPYASECVTGEQEYQTGTSHLASDALALLKEQQPKEPIYDCPLIRCPRCKNSIDMKQKYCDECGQAVKWDE